MPAKKTKRSHPGLCLDLLDDEHKALFREAAFILGRLGNLSVRLEYLPAIGVCLVCPVCRATAPVSDGNSDSDDAAIDHKEHCIKQHSIRLMQSDSVMRDVELEEWHRPQTLTGIAYKRHINSVLAKAEPQGAAQP